MTELVLGPLLRFASSRSGEGGRASIWVETSSPCTVEVHAGEVSATSRTFTVSGHHYALVVLRGLPESGETPYTVELDGERVWPMLEGWPPSTIRTQRGEETVRLAFGSCRVAAPLSDPKNGTDALAALAERMRSSPSEEWPEQLLLVGDQVYADDYVGPETKRFIRRRRDTSKGAKEQVADVEEYTHLYHETWTPEPVRWLLSTLPSAMIFDDHDIHDDWNTSAAWRESMHRTEWWQTRIEAGLMTYWIYQHLGNLDPDEVEQSELYARLLEEEDGTETLREYAKKADAEADGGGPTRWSYRRETGSSRLLVLDSRCGRVLGERREMLDEPEWAWIEEQLQGEYDHLLLATSLPYLLPEGVHHVEAFDEALAGGAWGKRAASLGEKLRQGADLEHWAAFQTSFHRMAGLVADVAAGKHGKAPASIAFLSGDVHFAYLAEAETPASEPGGTRIYQAVCSPLRNPLPWALRFGQKIACTRAVTRVGEAIARAIRLPPPPLSWRISEGPVFGNALATLTLAERDAELLVESARGGELTPAFSRKLT